MPPVDLEQLAMAPCRCRAMRAGRVADALPADDAYCMWTRSRTGEAVRGVRSSRYRLGMPGRAERGPARRRTHDHRATVASTTAFARRARRRRACDPALPIVARRSPSASACGARGAFCAADPNRASATSSSARRGDESRPEDARWSWRCAASANSRSISTPGWRPSRIASGAITATRTRPRQRGDTARSDRPPRPRAAQNSIPIRAGRMPVRAPFLIDPRGDDAMNALVALVLSRPLPPRVISKVQEVISPQAHDRWTRDVPRDSRELRFRTCTDPFASALNQPGHPEAQARTPRWSTARSACVHPTRTCIQANWRARRRRRGPPPPPPPT